MQHHKIVMSCLMKTIAHQNHISKISISSVMAINIETVIMTRNSFSQARAFFPALAKKNTLSEQALNQRICWCGNKLFMSFTLCRSDQSAPASYSSRCSCVTEPWSTMAAATNSVAPETKYGKCRVCHNILSSNYRTLYSNTVEQQKQVLTAVIGSCSRDDDHPQKICLHCLNIVRRLGVRNHFPLMVIKAIGAKIGRDCTFFTDSYLHVITSRGSHLAW